MPSTVWLSGTRPSQSGQRAEARCQSIGGTISAPRRPALENILSASSASSVLRAVRAFATGDSDAEQGLSRIALATPVVTRFAESLAAAAPHASFGPVPCCLPTFFGGVHLNLLSKRLSVSFAAGLVSLLAACGGGGDDGDSPPEPTHAIAFCRLVNNYDASYGVPGVDTMTVTSITGPSGATVSNAANGEYIVVGTYRLGSFPSARISLNWGGSTSYSTNEEHQIANRGTGEYRVRVVKTGGGSGNLFLSMSSGSSWMFAVVPVNTLCS